MNPQIVLMILELFGPVIARALNELLTLLLRQFDPTEARVRFEADATAAVLTRVRTLIESGAFPTGEYVDEYGTRFRWDWQAIEPVVRAEVVHAQRLMRTAGTHTPSGMA